MSTLDASPIRTLSLAWPRAGAWRADVSLEGGAQGASAPPVGATVTLTVGGPPGLVLRGTVLRAGLDAPGLPRLVVVGGAGWERLLTSPLSYQADAGVRLSTVLRDLAARAGETVEQPTDRVLGEAWAMHATRWGQPARLRDALVSLARAGALLAWRVDPDGVTRFGPRATDGQAVSVRATVLRRNAAVGLTTLGVDDPSGLVPGMMVDVGELAPVALARLVVVESSGKLEAEAWE